MVSGISAAASFYRAPQCACARECTPEQSLKDGIVSLLQVEKTRGNNIEYSRKLFTMRIKYHFAIDIKTVQNSTGSSSAHAGGGGAVPGGIGLDPRGARGCPPGLKGGGEILSQHTCRNIKL